MKSIKLYVEQSGFRLARVFLDGISSSVHDAFLCDALESDFQSVESCNSYLDDLRQLANRERDCVIWSGNAYVIKARYDGIFFENILAEDSGGEIPLHELIFAVACWRDFLEESHKVTIEKVIPDDLLTVKNAVFGS